MPLLVYSLISYLELPCLKILGTLPSGKNNQPLPLAYKEWHILIAENRL